MSPRRLGFAAIAAGFNLVMLADPEASPQDLTHRVAAITRLAHARGVAVEAEVGGCPARRPAKRGGAHRPTRKRPRRWSRQRGSTFWP